MGTSFGGILFFKMNKFIQHNFKEILIHNLMYNNKALYDKAPASDLQVMRKLLQYFRL